MTKRPSHVLHRTGGRCLHCDERGVFPVVEAILVAVLVLTAILFFTSVQRPTTGAEEGGIDLAQVAADSLQLMQSGEQGGLTFEEWVTALVNGDTTVAGTVDEYLQGTNGDGILPKGARYQLRLDNGVSSIPLLPTGGADAPRGARAAQVTLLPDWAAFKDKPALTIVHPGQVLSCVPILALVDPTPTTPVDSACPAQTYSNFVCLEGPTGQSTLVDLGDSLTTADNWIDHWQGAPPVDSAFTAPVLWKATQRQVPTDVLYGTWAAYGDACGGTDVTYFIVGRSDSALRTATATATIDESILAAPAGTFQASDVGKPITVVKSDGTSPAPFPEGTTIGAVQAAGDQATIHLGGAPIVATETAAVTLTIGEYSPYSVYGLQLVVWFGA